MASNGAAGMAALSRQLAQVSDDAVADLVRWFVPRSKIVGGRMRWFGKNVQLTSKLSRRRAGRGGNTVLIVGSPASCWSIKSYGRRGGYDVRARRAPTLAISAFAPGVFFAHVHIAKPAQGDRRWDRLVDEADRKFPDVVATLIDRKVM
jgi:hypothetical protein